jgi:hypothetical protein
MGKEATLVPVAECFVCEALNPVIVEEIPADIMGEKDDFTAIYCPVCENIINMEGNIEVEYYPPEELEKIGWKYEQ